MGVVVLLESVFEVEQTQILHPEAKSKNHVHTYIYM